VAEQVVEPLLASYRPELVLVSIGFDGHRDDPLAGMQLGDEDYRQLTRWLLDVARRVAGGRLIAVLEGGYDLDVLARCSRHLLDDLLEPLPYGPVRGAPQPTTDLLIEQVRARHAPYWWVFDRPRPVVGVPGAVIARVAQEERCTS
jgi:hypothetical protein